MRPAIPLESVEVFAEGLDHPEGLAFDADGVLWAGGESGQVYRVDRRGQVTEVANLGGFHLGVTISPSQTLFFCNLKKHSLVEVDRKGRVLRSWERAGRRKLTTPNASVFDSQGNLYFTDSGTWMRDDGAVHVLRPNGKIETLLGWLAFPNGIALSADEKTLYIVESTLDRVTAAPLLEDGTAGKPHVYARGLASVPDGAALDSHGNLYVTCYANHSVYKIAPGGRVTLYLQDVFGTLLAAPTNAAFAPDGSDYLYFANLNRWHISRVRTGETGMPLVANRTRGR